MGQGVPVAFYEGTPSPENLVCTTATSGVLVPGSCEVVTCVWEDPPGIGDGVDVTVVVDDDGTGDGPNSECVEGNNSAVIEDVFCQEIPE